MKYRILLTTSGGGNAQNVVRSLTLSSLDCFIVGVNIDKFELAKSNADKNYLIPRFNHPDYISTMIEIIKKEKIDFVIPNHEFEIKFLHDNKADEILNKCFLPKRDVVHLCVNKFNLIDFLKVNVPKSYMMRDYDYQLQFPLWIRLTIGAGSRGATLVYDEEELEFWLRYWKKHKGVSRNDFMVSEYLPGKDHHHFSLWKDGKMIVGKAIERIRYCCSKYTLTGTSSSPSLCKAVVRPDLNALTKYIIRSIDKNAQGLYGIDYKENSNGEDCLTEINIGRFPRINYIFNLGSKPNIAELYVKCGLGLPIENTEIKLPDETLYLNRDFDTQPLMKTSKQLEEISNVM